MEQREKVVEVKNLVKYYGSFRALEDVSFDVYKGDVFGFLGPNGAGKSTTIRTVLSLIRPSGGEVFLFGKNLLQERNSVLARIGCIVEKPDFYKYLSAEKNLEIFGRLSGRSISRKKIHETIEFVGLKGREKDKLGSFSHGMKQRLGIAQALLHDPELIILDEPTTGLDPQGILDIRNLILRLSREHNKTIMLSSHLLAEIELIANRMVIISKGKTLVHGAVNELLNEQELIVSFSVDRVEKAKEILLASRVRDAEPLIENNNLLVHLSQENIPYLNSEFCKQGIQVFSIETKRKLEDYFLKLVNS